MLQEELKNVYQKKWAHSFCNIRKSQFAYCADVAITSANKDKSVPFFFKSDLTELILREKSS